MIKQILTNKKWLVGIAGGAIVLIGGAAMVAGGAGGGKSGKYDYETVAIERGSVSRVVSASGAVQPREKVEVGSEVSGKIVTVLADYNDLVKKDQVLAQVDPETFQNTLDQNRARFLQSQASVENAKASVDRAQVALDKAEKDYNRQKALYAEQAVSQSAWETAEQNYKNAVISLATEKASLRSSQAGLATSQAAVQDAITKLERTKIRSPMDGVIINRQLEVGNTVQSSQSVKTLFIVAADLSEIEIDAAVVESDIGGIDPGDPVRFTVDAFPGDNFRGQVVQVRKLGAEQANVVTYTVVINAQNPGGKLYPGMTANVEITADQANNVLRIAANATKFQPPKEILEAMGGGPNGQRGGQGGQGGFPGGGQGGFPGGGQGGGQNFQGGGQGGGQQVAGGGERGGQSFQQGGNRGQGGQGFPGGGQGGGQGGNRGGGQGGQGGQGRGGQGGFGGQGGNPTGEWLKEAGIDDARAQKITSELQAETDRLRASMQAQMPQQQGGILGGNGGFGPPPGMQQQAMMQEMRGKMQAAQDKVLKANLNEEEYAKVAKIRAEMQSQKRVMVYKVNDKGELERHQLMIGLSDGNFAQVVRGAAEGDKFVIRATPAGKGGQAKKS